MENAPKATRLFPKARGYRLWPAKVAEPSSAIPGTRGFYYTERHLQCVWFDAALRPGNLKTEQGDEIVVEHPGQWNLEDGPDFLDAVLRIGPDRRRLAGDVEIHIHPSDWQRHGHARNPAYAHVIAHVTYFSGAAAAVPTSRRVGTIGGVIQVSLKDSLAANLFFSFESLDLTAYPYTVREPITPCVQVLKTWGPDRVADMLESAGEERLQGKAARMAGTFASQAPDQILYEEIMTALGYKNNRAPFRYLAEQLPLETLRKASGRNTLKAYALLMGVAGLLPAQTPSRWDAETRAFVRQLWDHWWKHQAAWSARALRRKNWKLSGLRPQNHPQRRLMLAAILFTRADDLTRSLTALNTTSADECFRQIATFFHLAADTYWQRRLTFAGKRQTAAIALMGTHRVAAIVTNVIVPFLAALGNRQVMRPEFLRHLPPEEDNQIIRQTAHNLLGPDHNPDLYRSGLRQQGLIQIFHDFCLTDRSRCENCVLLKALAEACEA
ncbi:MAG: DUF2851 family protein [Verrucomicrobia bacterium]|nr:DUF2851 family protein [Verrucomicrobiota bacterium]MBU1857639.1 DUF2851 family protein [Verrucomicrobiota bacterium]